MTYNKTHLIIKMYEWILTLKIQIVMALYFPYHIFSAQNIANSSQNINELHVWNVSCLKQKQVHLFFIDMCIMHNQNIETWKV